MGRDRDVFDGRCWWEVNCDGRRGEVVAARAGGTSIAWRLRGLGEHVVGSKGGTVLREAERFWDARGRLVVGGIVMLSAGGKLSMGAEGRVWWRGRKGRVFYVSDERIKNFTVY